jgi:hypothetical protein
MSGFMTFSSSFTIIHLCKVKFALEQAVKTQSGSTGIALLFL